MQLAQLEALLGEKYQIMRRIGGGGMAQVFLARHRRHGGAFAVKVLSEYLAQDPQIVARFEQEARTAATLSGHPNIVPIFDIGQGDGLHYIIMQFISGEDLASWLRRNGKLAPPDAANVIAQTAEALIWSESHKVVHRDLKPANMLLDTNGRIMILDFGISKAADVSDGLTRPGESLGTPCYMSPEQIRGLPCDVRSDLYSLGVIFFELMTGKRPFDHESVTAIQMAHLTEAPPDLLSVEPELPEICGQLVQKMLQKRPEDRYQSPQRFLEELRNLGATSGPGQLRPQLNMAIEEDLHQPITGTPANMQTISAANIGSRQSADFSDAPVKTATAVSSLISETPMAATSTIAQREPRAAARKKPKGLWALTIVVLLLAPLSVAFFLPEHPASAFQDAHGRMVLVPAGSFIYGDNSPDAPRRQQTLSLPAYYIDETEVSNREYRHFIEATGHAPPNADSYADKPDDPVSGVSYDDASAYAAWVGKRLPTEEEWEKAARGTDGRPYPWGSDAWTTGVPTTVQPVESFPDRKSPYGAFNMAGNVFEWTATVFPAGDREFTDMRSLLGSPDFSRRWYAIKGGSFSPHGDVFFRCFMRRGFPSDQHSPIIGFRCVRAVPQQGLLSRLHLLIFGR
ncbi:bifunctional serine/threonine-protein kinase/formylglycine-generating enzyme family protein [Paracidobacterium acidisoli]|nr:bifunctional serine/threonine-protein kinase/formylglycine-generating enzyme family protein [Paracidobacterium acidisoli]MBT9331043.1 SUMF1/EgtB/PvdO family nonheme iron enzyme [Paracidobacterium acidisoli]